MSPLALAKVFAAGLAAGILFIIFTSCEKEPASLTAPPSPTPYSFRPSAPPTPVPKPRTQAVVKPTPTPVRGWINIQADRWDRARVKPEKVHFAQAIAAQIARNRPRYETVSSKTGVPWQVIGCIHSMEGSLNFRTNLGQGDPLTSQSRHIPKNRPPVPPKPPFQWEYAAEDSIRYDGLDRQSWTRIDIELQNIEAWNGLGYQRFHPDVPSPYLWSWSSLERPGKYVADGQWSSSAVSQQCGVAPILKSLGYP